MTVRVFLWFDVEDYITPESDVALGRVVEILDRCQVRATFKMVGDKVRGLQRRGHGDILRSLESHDVGYHTDYHSRPPTISEYLMGLEWEEGVAAFLQREQDGVRAVQHAFGRVPSCYGQPGGSWAPHVYPALRQWGIHTYLDAGPWIELEGGPHRYCGILDMMGLAHTMHIGISGGKDMVAERLRLVMETIDSVRHTGGEISLYAHECEFVTQQFWDAINFAGGKDTSREEWQPAPVLGSEEQASRYAALEEFVRALRAVPDVEFVVASQAPLLYPDRAKGRTYTPEQIATMAASMVDGVTHQRCDEAWVSPAEVYSLVVRLMAERVRSGRWPERLPYHYVDGPARTGQVRGEATSLSLDDLYGTCLYESAFIGIHSQMPSEIQVGTNWLTPADFLATVGARLGQWMRGGTDDAPVTRGRLEQAQYVPDHVSWDWIVFPPGFDGDPLLEAGKLQTWTLKPA
jgi:hypothetical protein